MNVSGNPPKEWGERAARALAQMGALWRRHLDFDWTPPPADSSFPWAQVRLSLAALVPGLEAASEWRARTKPEGKTPATSIETVGLILAGNTPLMSWSPLAACLLAGARVFVKMSRDETLWPHLFVESLAEVDPEVAERVLLDVWPGDDPRTTELVRKVDAIVAFGSDATLASLREKTPPETPFFGFGQAISMGLWRNRSVIDTSPDFNDYLTTIVLQIQGFARDLLTYDQSGCLSPQTLFVEEESGDEFAVMLQDVMVKEIAPVADALKVSAAVNAAIAHTIREARDLALFDGAQVIGDPGLRWTVIRWSEERDLPPVVGHGVVNIVPIRDVSRLPERFGALRGRISCIGVAGEVTPELRAALEAEGVSRICAPGEMQTPPLDWPNGGFDLLFELRRISFPER